jgi:hypothetical protein
MARKKVTKQVKAPKTPLELLQSYDPAPTQDDDSDETSISASDFKALQEQVAALNKQMSDKDNTILSLMSNPAGNTKIVVDEAPKLDMTGLPNALDDPDAYNKELSNRVQAYTAASLQHASKVSGTVSDRQDKIKGLWTDFNTNPEYEDYDDQTKVGFAAQQVVERAKKRGVDVEKYMLGATDKFFADVKAEYDKVFGAPGGGTTEETDDGQGGDDDTIRTAGIIGGLESSGKPTPNVASKKKETGDMVDELQNFQKNTGFY